MLVLTRKLGEKILIGDDIAITVVDIGKSRVKVGIEAPWGHRILRSELVLEAEPPGARHDSDVGMIPTKVVTGLRPSKRRAAEPVGA